LGIDSASGRRTHKRDDHGTKETLPHMGKSQQMPEDGSAAHRGQMRLLTIGHGTLSADEFIELLRGAGATSVVDVRSAPGSRHNPQFGRVDMELWLPPAAITYSWQRALGGFRKTSSESPNVALRHASFRGYADYMLTQEFATGADELVRSAGSALTVVMCSESLWWRCHRRLLSDYLTLIRDVVVCHLMHNSSLDEHRLTAGVRAAGDHVVYDQLPALGDG
jgi:uncharacterized protein (DUF488 family)